MAVAKLSRPRLRHIVSQNRCVELLASSAGISRPYMPAVTQRWQVPAVTAMSLAACTPGISAHTTFTFQPTCS